MLPVIEYSVNYKENLYGHTSPSGESEKLTPIIETESEDQPPHFIPLQELVLEMKA
jgi:hypothetical protein